MDDKLTHQDYMKVLEYYDVSMPKSHASVKKKAEDILADKLCRCIKKVKRSQNTSNERVPVGVCRTSVIHRKKLDIYQFSCDKTPSLKKYKGKTYKVKKRAQFQQTRKHNQGS